MTERELSEKLDTLATRLEELRYNFSGDLEKKAELQAIVVELRTLSNQKYTPGNTSWSDLKQAAKPKKNYTDNRGRDLPF